MRWFRSNRGGVAWVAVFALACQFLLSFGHVHLGKYSGGPVTWMAADSAAPIALPSSPQDTPTALPDDFCAICANLGLASALLVPDSPIVVIPGSFAQVLPWFPATIVRAPFDHLPLGARGPPQSLT
jgi:hypothetical protein